MFCIPSGTEPWPQLGIRAAKQRKMQRGEAKAKCTKAKQNAAKQRNAKRSETKQGAARSCSSPRPPRCLPRLPSSH